MSENIKDKVNQITDPKNLQLRLVDAVKTISDKNDEIAKLNDKMEILSKEYESKIKALETELKKIKTSKSMFSDIKDKEDKQRLILMLRARQFSKQAILKYIDSNAIDGIDESLIDFTVDNIKTLSPELESYYIEQKTIFQDKIKVSGSEIKKIIEDILMENLDEINRLIREEEDSQVLKQLINEKNNIAGKFSSLLGNIVEETKEATVNVEIVQLQNDMKEKANKIVNFSLDGITTVEDEDFN